MKSFKRLLSFSLAVFFVFLFTLFFRNNAYAFQPTVGSWTLITPSNYQVNEVTVDPNNSNIIYISTNYSGILKSTDGGNTWNAINNGFPDIPNMTFTDTAIDPSNSNILYSGAFHDIYTPSLVGGIFKSTDGGNSWVNITNNIGPNTGILDFAIDPVDSSVYATIYSNGGVWKSADGGSTWFNNYNDGSYRVVIDKVNHDVVYAGASTLGGNMIKSTDAGNN